MEDGLDKQCVARDEIIPSKEQIKSKFTILDDIEELESNMHIDSSQAESPMSNYLNALRKRDLSPPPVPKDTPHPAAKKPLYKPHANKENSQKDQGRYPTINILLKCNQQSSMKKVKREGSTDEIVIKPGIYHYTKIIELDKEIDQIELNRMKAEMTRLGSNQAKAKNSTDKFTEECELFSIACRKILPRGP